MNILSKFFFCIGFLVLLITVPILYIIYRILGLSKLPICLKNGHHYRVSIDNPVWVLQSINNTPSDKYECVNCHKSISEKKLQKNKKYKNC